MDARPYDARRSRARRPRRHVARVAVRPTGHARPRHGGCRVHLWLDAAPPGRPVVLAARGGVLGGNRRARRRPPLAARCGGGDPVLGAHGAAPAAHCRRGAAARRRQARRDVVHGVSLRFTANRRPRSSGDRFRPARAPATARRVRRRHRGDVELARADFVRRGARERAGPRVRARGRSPRRAAGVRVDAVVLGASWRAGVVGTDRSSRSAARRRADVDPARGRVPGGDRRGAVRRVPHDGRARGGRRRQSPHGRLRRRIGECQVTARTVVFVAVALGLATGACTYLSDEPTPFRPPGVTSDVNAEQRGLELYERDCAWCHGSAGEGTSFGPDLNGPLDGGAYTHFMLATGRMPLDDPGMRAAPASPRYEAADIDAIVRHVETFGGTGPGVPTPSPAPGDLAEGAELYLDNCAACHSSTAVGGALTSGEVVPDLDGVSSVVVAEAMLVGPGCPNTSRTCGPGEGAMPRFDLDERSVNSILRYIEYLQRPIDEGGAPIGRVGPVAEGAVALGVAVVALLLLARWIGTRTGDRG